MSSIFVHASIGLLSGFFPNLPFLPLLASSLFPDIEYLPMAIYGFIRTRKISRTINIVGNTWILHSIAGTFFISLPLLYFIFSLLGYASPGLIGCILIGLISHLILDLPAHPALMLLWPFKKFYKNPFLIKWRVQFLKRIYPYKKLEVSAYQYLAEFHWSVISMIIPIVLIILAMVL